MHIPKPNLYNMVCIGFRDARRDIQDPPPAQLPPSPPDLHDDEHMDARPDQEEIEEAINNFLQQLDKQEKKGFKDLASVLSAPVPTRSAPQVSPGYPVITWVDLA